MNCDKRDAFQSKVSNMEIEYHNGGFFFSGTPSNICTIDKIFSTSSESSGIDGGSCVFSHGGSRLGIGRAKRDELLKKEEKELRSPLFLKIYFCKDSFFGGTLLERPGGPGKKRCFNAADKAPLLVANLVIKISTIA